jgi:very-short-patch-repair endonuclease
MDVDKNNFCNYNKRLRPHANKLRKDMTKAEACLWKYLLRAGQIKGYKFSRQRPVLDFIADLMCKELRLVIEVDGITHDNKIEKDKYRDDKCKKAGFLISRFIDEEVLTNIEGVKVAIEMMVEKIISWGLPLHPLQRGTKL